MFDYNELQHRARTRKSILLPGRWQRAAVAALLALVAGTGGCEPAVDAPRADEGLVSITADAVLFDMEDYLTEDGVRSGVIRADTAYVYNDSSQIRMWGVEMTLFHDDGRERAHVTSERGILHQATERMEARGNVVLVMDGGVQRVESPELYYDPRANRIWSDSNSVLTRENGRVTRGTCFRSDLEFRDFTVCDIRGAAVRDEGPGGGG